MRAARARQTGTGGARATSRSALATRRAASADRTLVGRGTFAVRLRRASGDGGSPRADAHPPLSPGGAPRSVEDSWSGKEEPGSFRSDRQRDRAPVGLCLGKRAGPEAAPSNRHESQSLVRQTSRNSPERSSGLTRRERHRLEARCQAQAARRVHGPTAARTADGVLFDRPKRLSAIEFLCRVLPPALDKPDQAEVPDQPSRTRQNAPPGRPRASSADGRFGFKIRTARQSEKRRLRIPILSIRPA